MTTTDRGVPAAYATPPSDARTSRLPGLLATVIGLLGVVSTVGALLPGVSQSWDENTPAAWLTYVADVQPNLGWATVLFLVAGALAARKRAAWWLVVFYTALFPHR